MKSFFYQFRWNLILSVTGQIISVCFLALASRMLGLTDFGYYIWIISLPGLVVIFDLYLGLSLQNHLTKLILKNNEDARDKLVWGFVWGMLVISLIFILIGLLFVILITSGYILSVTSIPANIIWLGFFSVCASALGVPLLVVGVGFNAARMVHVGAKYGIFTDLFIKSTFLVTLFISKSFAISICLFLIATLFVNILLAKRFMNIFHITFIGPTIRLVKSAFNELWHDGNGKQWAMLRVADGFFKNSEIVIGAFFINVAIIGNFSLLDRLSNMLMLLANSAFVVLVPNIAVLRLNGEHHKLAGVTKLSTYISVAVLIIFSFFFLLFGEKIASIWAGRKIDFSILIVILICLRAWTRVMSSLSWTLLFGLNLIDGLLHATVLSGILYALLYGLLIQQYGVLSILISQIIAQSVFIFYCWRVQSKYKLQQLIVDTPNNRNYIISDIYRPMMRWVKTISIK